MRWNLTTNGVFSVSSAYKIQFMGCIQEPTVCSVWKSQSEQKVKVYMWLLLQIRNWTADILAARGWSHSSTCCFCDQSMEADVHLLLQCPYAKDIWAKISHSQGRIASIASTGNYVLPWRNRCNKLALINLRKKEMFFAAYVAWHIWKERNRRIFQGKSLTTDEVVQLFKDEISLSSKVFWE